MSGEGRGRGRQHKHLEQRINVDDDPVLVNALLHRFRSRRQLQGRDPAVVPHAHVGGDPAAVAVHDVDAHEGDGAVAPVQAGEGNIIMS